MSLEAAGKDMEVCDDMAVDLDMTNMRKRNCMDEMLNHPLNKRTCHGLQNVTETNGILVNPLGDCHVACCQRELSSGRIEPINGFAPKELVQPVCMPLQNHHNAAPRQGCARCAAGESGHINHILNY